MSTSKDDYPGKRIAEKLGWKEGPQYQDRDVDAYKKEFIRIRRSNCFPAFQALRLIAVNQVSANGDFNKDFGGISPDEPIAVPWWILFALSVGWTDYQEHAKEKNMGQAFGLEGGRRGQHRIINLDRTRRVQQRLALAVASEIAEGKKKTSAVKAVADIQHASPEKVWAAVRRYATVVDNAAALLRTKGANSVK